MNYQNSDLNRKGNFFGKKFFISFFLIIIFVFLAYGFFISYKINSVEKKINVKAENKLPSVFETARSLITKDEINLESDNDRINILLLGIAGKDRSGTNLTDTIMLMSLNVKTGQVALISIPRDLYVTIPEMEIQTKINSAYQIGLKNNANDKSKDASTIVSTVEEILDEKINYFVVLNYAGFEKIIDSVGGINVMNERDIYDSRYPGPNYSYETFELKKGFHHLDGTTALKYARERHSDPEGDFGRAKRQQQVMQATKNRIFSPETFLNVFSLNKLFNALGENIVTNISSEEIKSFYNLSKKLDTQNINNVVIDAWNKDSFLKVSHVFYGDIRSFILVPRIGNYSEIQELTENIFDLNKIKRRKAEIANEDASIGIINQSDNSEIIGKIKKLLNERFGYKNIYTMFHSESKIAQKTLVYDQNNDAKPFTLDEIATRLPAQVSYARFSLPATTLKNPDLIIIIGKDLISKYNMEEDTLEDLNNARDEEEKLLINSND